MKKQPTEAALTARAIRKELKKLGIKASVTSSNFAGGDAVRISTTNLYKNDRDKLKEAVAKYQYGHFDGMCDIYEYSNTVDDIPQVKYVQIQNDFDDEIKQGFYSKLKAQWVGLDNAPDDVNKTHSFYYEQAQIWLGQFIHRELLKVEA